MDLGSLNLNRGLSKVIQQIIATGKDLFTVDELKSLAGGDYKNVLKKLYDSKALVSTQAGEKADLSKLKDMMGNLGGLGNLGNLGDKLGNLGNLGGLGKIFK